MSDDHDKWSEAWSRLTNAVEHAREAGMTQEEIQDVVDENNPANITELHVGGGPKRKKP